MAQQLKQPEMGVLEFTSSTRSGKQDMHMLTGKYSSNYRAEAVAMARAAEELTTNPIEIKPNVLILTDALSVLEGLKNARKNVWILCIEHWQHSHQRQRLPYSGSLPTVAFQGMR